MGAMNLYESDFYAWTLEQAKLLKKKDFSHIDLMHLVEEVEDMGNRHADELQSRLEKLLMHLLKWEFQPDRKSKSWYKTIAEQRLRIERRIAKMPSLKAKLDTLFIEAYFYVRNEASIERLGYR